MEKTALTYLCPDCMAYLRYDGKEDKWACDYCDGRFSMEELEQRGAQKKENDYNVALQIKDYIDAGQGINSSLDDFEKQFSYSKFYLEREFKKLHGISLIAYRNNKKMELAAKLLKNENVTTVVEKLHFSSIYAFSRAFKKHFGLSPTEYKKQLT